MLKSNISACHLKLEDWKEATKAATAALDGLDKLQGKGKDSPQKAEEKGEEEEADEEIVSEGALKAEDTSDKGKREADIERIRAKALMRRARARSEQGGWANLSGAEEGMLKLSAGRTGADMMQITRRWTKCRTSLWRIRRLSSGSSYCSLQERKLHRRRKWVI